MKRVKDLVLVLVILAVAVIGCQSWFGYEDPAGDLYTPDEAAQLPVEKQAELKPVTVTEPRKDIVAPAQSGLATAKDVQERYGGLLGTAGEAIGIGIWLLQGIVTAWAGKKIIRQRKESRTREGTIRDVLGMVQTGSALTAQVIERFKVANTEAWKLLGPDLKSASLNPNAIMPKAVGNGAVESRLPPAA